MNIFRNFTGTIDGFRQPFELFSNLVKRSLRGKYVRTVLGQLWSLANPIVLMVIYTFVFSFIIKIPLNPGLNTGLDSFPLWLLCGLLPWIFFSNVLTQGATTLVENSTLIKKVYFERSLLVTSSGVAVFITWSIEMSVLLLAIIISGFPGVIMLIPVIFAFMFLLLCFAMGISLMLSILNSYFRDTQHLLSIALQLGLYLTPIVYPLTLVVQQSESMGPLLGNFTLLQFYELNPMEHFTMAFRSLIYEGLLPSVSNTLSCIVTAFISLILGWIIFVKNQNKLAEVL